MIDNDKKQQKAEQKERVRQRMRVKVDAENYEYIPAKEQVDYYSSCLYLFYFLICHDLHTFPLPFLRRRLSFHPSNFQSVNGLSTHSL